MRQLLRFLAPYKGLLLVCVVLILVLTGIQIGIPYLSKIAIDNYMIPPLGIVSLSEPPSSANFISLGDKHYLIDLRLIDRETREAWEAMGVLSRERYLFVAEDSSHASIAIRNQQAFTQVAGGYLVDQESLRKVPSRDLVVLRDSAIAGVVRIASLFAFALLARFLFGAVQVYLLQLAGQKVMYDMRQQIFAHVLRLPVSYFDRTPVGRLVTR
ncbi:MAG: ABC transporter transmembrane domain-containing protein, partial [Candidatus Bipolaricaulota bacterium]